MSYNRYKTKILYYNTLMHSNIAAIAKYDLIRIIRITIVTNTTIRIFYVDIFGWWYRLLRILSNRTIICIIVVLFKIRVQMLPFPIYQSPFQNHPLIWAINPILYRYYEWYYETSYHFLSLFIIFIYPCFIFAIHIIFNHLILFFFWFFYDENLTMQMMVCHYTMEI
jgi:hypothetical protein